jgi:hypothetical protein
LALIDTNMVRHWGLVRRFQRAAKFRDGTIAAWPGLTTASLQTEAFKIELKLSAGARLDAVMLRPSQRENDHTQATQLLLQLSAQERQNCLGDGIGIVSKRPVTASRWNFQFGVREDLTLALGKHDWDVGIVSAPDDKRRQI